jgi:hypothetical protein
MPGGMEVLCGVLVLGVIATPHLPANHTDTQVNPRIAQAQALLATLPTGEHIVDLISMGANLYLFPILQLLGIIVHYSSFLYIIPSCQDINNCNIW